MKFIRKICLGLLLAFTLVLVGCGSKGGQKKNKAISEEQFITIFKTICSRSGGFDDEPTFKADPNNSEYEIGYEWDFQCNYGNSDDENDFQAFINHNRIRREKETKSFIYSTDLDNDPSGETFDICYLGKKQGTYEAGFYLLTYKNGYSSQEVKKISYKDVFAKAKIDVWEISDDEIVKSYSFETKKYSIKLKGDKETSEFSMGRFGYTAGSSFVVRYSNDETALAISRTARQKISDEYSKQTQTN